VAVCAVVAERPVGARELGAEEVDAGDGVGFEELGRGGGLVWFGF